jgi:glycosyltransferase involved in cell wall biosynthesis
MTTVLLSAAHHVWMTIPMWEERWRPYTLGRRVPFTWLPVPSGLSGVPCTDAGRIHDRCVGPDGALLGHFGTYGPAVTVLLLKLIPLVMACRVNPSVMLLGVGSEGFRRELIARHPLLESRVYALGHLPVSVLAEYLTACDVLMQPYPDGVSSRRTSVMAGLSLGRPIVTTSGSLTEPLWAESGAVRIADVDDCGAFAMQVEELLADAAERGRIGEKGRALYAAHFDLRHTITALRGSVAA